LKLTALEIKRLFSQESRKIAKIDQQSAEVGLREKFDELEVKMDSSKKANGPERPKEKPRILTAED
jgi:hypothetical protein